MVKENEPISLCVLEPFFVLFCCLSFPFNSIHNQISNILKIRREKRNDLCKAEQYRKLEKICYASMRTLSFSNMIWKYFSFRWLAEIFFRFFQEETITEIGRSSCMLEHIAIKLKILLSTNDGFSKLSHSYLEFAVFHCSFYPIKI